MTKRELITRITNLNPTAAPDFLAEFDDADLAEYLEHLQWVGAPGSREERQTAPAEADAPVPEPPEQTPEPLPVAQDAQEESPTWLF